MSSNAAWSKLPKDLLTTDQLCEIFDRTRMTIYLWRNKEDLPFIILPIDGMAKPPVRFSWKAVVGWATTRGKIIVKRPEELTKSANPKPRTRRTLNSAVV